VSVTFWTDTPACRAGSVTLSGMGEVVACAQSRRGEVVVRRREDGTLELRVNGVFVMDTAETSTERRLARTALDQVSLPRRVLVGGLGLGYTLAEILADGRVGHVTVAEIEPAVVEWVRAGLLPGAAALADPRVDMRVGDVRDLLRSEPTRSYDVVLLDVDNGPDFLVYDDNAAVYGTGFLTECRRVLTDAGIVAIWSSTRSAQLEEALREVFAECAAVPLAIDLQGRDERYWLFTGKMVR
jgi:spermidine synthase